MEWFTANIFFLVILLLCVGMHLFGHGGHGGHGSHGDADRRGRDDHDTTRDTPHRH